MAFPIRAEALRTLSRNLARAELHVAEGQKRLSAQEDLISKLKLAGLEIALAEALLVTMQETRVQYVYDRDRIRSQLQR
jgi:hypothetical protein